MTSNRVYRKEITSCQAIEEIKQAADFKFNSGVVKAFLQVVAPFPIGCSITFKNGAKGIVKAVSRVECLVEMVEGPGRGDTFNLYHCPHLEVDKVFLANDQGGHKGIILVLEGFFSLSSNNLQDFRVIL